MVGCWFGLLHVLTSTWETSLGRSWRRRSRYTVKIFPGEQWIRHMPPRQRSLCRVLFIFTLTRSSLTSNLYTSFAPSRCCWRGYGSMHITIELCMSIHLARSRSAGSGPWFLAGFSRGRGGSVLARQRRRSKDHLSSLLIYHVMQL